MSKRINIVTYAMTNNVTELKRRDLFGNNLLLNSKDKRKNRSINKNNNNVFFEKELTITGINL